MYKMGGKFVTINIYFFLKSVTMTSLHLKLLQATKTSGCKEKQNWLLFNAKKYRRAIWPTFQEYKIQEQYQTNLSFLKCLLISTHIILSNKRNVFKINILVVTRWPFDVIVNSFYTYRQTFLVLDHNRQSVLPADSGREVIWPQPHVQCHHFVENGV